MGGDERGTDGEKIETLETNHDSWTVPNIWSALKTVITAPAPPDYNNKPNINNGGLCVLAPPTGSFEPSFFFFGLGGIMHSGGCSPARERWERRIREITKIANQDANLSSGSGSDPNCRQREKEGDESREIAGGWVRKEGGSEATRSSNRFWASPASALTPWAERKQNEAHVLFTVHADVSPCCLNVFAYRCGDTCSDLWPERKGHKRSVEIRKMTKSQQSLRLDFVLTYKCYINVYI